MPNRAPSPSVAHQRARVGAISRAVRAGERPPADLDDAKRELIKANLAEQVKKVVDGWPKLTDAQLHDVAALLRVGGAAK